MANFLSSKSSPKERIEHIVNSPDAQLQAQALPAEDLLLMINQVGKSDALELIELLSAEQIQTIFDLDIWHHEILDDHKLADWLSALFEANPHTAFAQTRELDTEFLTILLRKYAVIHDLLENDDPCTESSLFVRTLDNHYLLEFITEEDSIDVSRFLKRFLEELMGEDFMTAIRLIESARFETDALLHEDALRLRDGRLQDLGFLPTAERLSVLSYVDVDKKKTKSVMLEESKNEGKGITKLRYALPSLKDLPFLREALTGLSHPALERAWEYIVVVINRVHMAQKGNYSDAEEVSETARYTLNHIEMALSYLSNGDLSQAKNYYLAHAPQDLFQIGHSIVLRLRRDYLKMSQHPALNLCISSAARIDYPLREVIRGLLLQEPLFYQGLTDPKQIDYRTFKDLTDVALVTRAVFEVAFRCALLGNQGLGFEETQSQGDPELRPMATILATYFANTLLGTKSSFAPLSRVDFARLFERLVVSQSGRRFSEEDKSTCVSLLKETSHLLVGLVGIRTIAIAEEKAHAYAHTVLGFMESELSSVDPHSLDPKLILSIQVDI